MSERQGTPTANQQNQKKLSFILQPFPMRQETVEHNSAEHVSQDLVHLTKLVTEASVSFDFESEEREEITEIADVPAHTPAPAMERVKKQS